jgi:succinyl-CoA synthetase alpha subunit/malate-CoA ligase subunit alpha
MGHAGAVISGDSDTAQAKLDAMEALGLLTVRNPALIGQTVARALERTAAARG